MSRRVGMWCGESVEHHHDVETTRGLVDTNFPFSCLLLCSYICVIVYWVIMLLFLPLEIHILLSSER